MGRRILGTILILLALLGIALCALGVVYVWRAAEDVAVATDEALRVTADTLDEVDSSLYLASNTLDDAGFAVNGLYATTVDVSDTLASTRLTIEEMAELTEDELPRSIEASLLALDGLEDSAGLIDQLLRSFSQFGIGNYDPVVPLGEAVADARAGLAGVPASLRTMGEGLNETSAGLDEVQEGVVTMSGHVQGIADNVDEADAAISDHRATLRELRAQVRALRRDVEEPIEAVAWGTTLLLIWLALSQLALIRWGVVLWRPR